MTVNPVTAAQNVSPNNNWPDSGIEIYAGNFEMKSTNYCNLSPKNRLTAMRNHSAHSFQAGVFRSELFFPNGPFDIADVDHQEIFNVVFCFRRFGLLNILEAFLRGRCRQGSGRPHFLWR